MGSRGKPQRHIEGFTQITHSHWNHPLSQLWAWADSHFFFLLFFILNNWSFRLNRCWLVHHQGEVDGSSALIPQPCWLSSFQSKTTNISTQISQWPQRLQPRPSTSRRDDWQGKRSGLIQASVRRIMAERRCLPSAWTLKTFSSKGTGRRSFDMMPLQWKKGLYHLRH